MRSLECRTGAAKVTGAVRPSSHIARKKGAAFGLLAGSTGTHSYAVAAAAEVFGEDWRDEVLKRARRAA